MKIGIDWNQASTWRGIVMAIAGMAALILYFRGNLDAAQGVIAGGISITGALGFGIKD